MPPAGFWLTERTWFEVKTLKVSVGEEGGADIVSAEEIKTDPEKISKVKN